MSLQRQEDINLQDPFLQSLAVVLRLGSWAAVSLLALHHGTM